MFELSALVRTLVAETTVYFLVMVAPQIYIQLSLSVVNIYLVASFHDRWLQIPQGVGKQLQAL